MIARTNTRIFLRGRIICSVGDNFYLECDLQKDGESGCTFPIQYRRMLVNLTFAPASFHGIQSERLWKALFFACRRLVEAGGILARGREVRLVVALSRVCVTGESIRSSSSSSSSAFGAPIELVESVHRATRLRMARECTRTYARIRACTYARTQTVVHACTHVRRTPCDFTHTRGESNQWPIRSQSMSEDAPACRGHQTNSSV